MAYKIIRPRHGIKSLWNTYKSRIYKLGEMLVESPESGVGSGPVNIKFGDGVTDYEKLPYAVLAPVSEVSEGVDNPPTSDAVKKAIENATPELPDDLLSQSDVVDNLESNRSDLPLSARMGSELNKKLIELWEKVFPNIVWLFSPTEKYTDTTGNYFASGNMWSSYYWGSGVPTISTTTNGYMKIKTANDKTGSVFSQKTVDVTDFDKIVVQYITIRKGNLEAFGLTTSTGDRYSFAKHVELLNSNSTIATATLDVSKLSGKYYLGFSLCESGQWVEMDITSIHME